jgi:GT2 family glycosyltransferase
MNGSNAFSDLSTPPVTCVVLNWNGWVDTVACLESLAGQTYSALRIIVVDNGSTNDSVAQIRAAFPDVMLIETRKNLGFASGNNVGIRRAVEDGAAYVWLLNNDTVAPSDTCSKLVAKALREPRAGLIGSVLYFMHEPTSVQAWGGGDVNVWLGQSTHFEAPAPLGATSYLTFASVLIPREVILRVGILYEGSFMYWEDSDYALRVTKAGYDLAVAQDTAVLHKEGGSTGRRSPLMDRYVTAAGLHFLRRHSPLPWMSMMIFLALKFANRFVRMEWKNLRGVWLGMCDYWKQRCAVYRETI